MRRVVTVVFIIMVASALAACSSTPAASTSSAPASTAAAANAANAAAAAKAAAPVGDIYSPTQTVTPNELLSKDAAVVPAAVLARVTAGKPMLIFFYDPTTKVEADQRTEITAALKKYPGAIDLVVIDYTAGITSSDSSATVDPEIQKLNLFAGSLKVNTTPYIVFVDRFSRITYRFAGYVDRGLLIREVLRATQ
jgi:thioredoxin-related protein